MRNRHEWRGAALVILVACMAMPAARAVEQPDLYTVEVQWDASASDGRKRAYRDGLAQVLVRISGDEAAAVDPSMSALFPDPGELVLGYQEGRPGRLLVSFDGVEIGARLRAAGRPVWGSDRPLTLVWLALERGDGTRAIVGEDPIVGEDGAGEVPVVTALREQLRQAATRRGIPVRFPLLDQRDFDAVSDSDIWGGFSDRLLAASRRYGADSVLVGRVRESAPRSARWEWLFAGDSRTFSGSVDNMIGAVTGALASQFASSGQGSTDVRIAVSGITDLRAFATVSRFLRTQSLLAAVNPLAVTADEMLFSVDALTSRERLAQILDGDVLERVDGDGAGSLARFGAAAQGGSGAALPVPDLRYRYRGAGGQRGRADAGTPGD
jgi:hypothetical protein